MENIEITAKSIIIPTEKGYVRTSGGILIPENTVEYPIKLQI